MKLFFSSLKERCHRSLLSSVLVIASGAKQSTVSISPVSPAPVSPVSSSMKLSSCKNSSSSCIRNGSFVIRNGIGFTLVELMIVIAIIGVLAASLFPMMSGYMARARDTARYTGAKDINLALRMYRDDIGTYPSFLTYDHLSTGFADECITAGCNNNWTGTIEPITRQYIGKSPRDPSGGIWPLSYMYGYASDITAALGPTQGVSYFCPSLPTTAPYILIFATEQSRSHIGEAFASQGQMGTYGRYCLTGD